MVSGDRYYRRPALEWEREIARARVFFTSFALFLIPSVRSFFFSSTLQFLKFERIHLWGKPGADTLDFNEKIEFFSPISIIPSRGRTKIFFIETQAHFFLLLFYVNFNDLWKTESLDGSIKFYNNDFVDRCYYRLGGYFFFLIFTRNEIFNLLRKSARRKMIIATGCVFYLGIKKIKIAF